MQKAFISLLVPTVLTAGIMMRAKPSPPAPVDFSEASKTNFRRDAAVFANATERLLIDVRAAGEPHADRILLMEDLRICRKDFKKIETFVSQFFPEVAFGLNGPPVPEAEDPYMEYRDPRGLQVIEALLGGKNGALPKRRLLEETTLLAETAGTLSALTYDLSVQETGLLQGIRLAVIRLSTLGITGYDAPVLRSGLEESAVVARSIGETLAVLPGTGDLQRSAANMAAALSKQGNFDDFDRLVFIRQSVIPFETALRRYCSDRHILLPATGLLNETVTDIYSPGALRPVDAFPGDAALTALGKKWFSDKSLSGNGMKSCASCHDPARGFTDGLPVSPGIRSDVKLKRNTPTLLYSGYQYRQFWDGRAAGLADQIVDVLQNREEMDIDTPGLARRWKNDPAYDTLIQAVFRDKPMPSPTRMIATAVGAYVNRLGAFRSPFDRYMQGEEDAIGAPAKNGFNLFMGKARCGTCHFAPLFNGSLPPGFDRTEFETAGTTEGTDFRRPVLDKDPGRYGVYPLPFNRYSFKTPTVRNAERTAPYMHHGRFKDLNSVLIFYNNGGGAGMGLDLPGQTLSPDSLRLTSAEMDDIIAFIHSLSDKTDQTEQ